MEQSKLDKFFFLLPPKRKRVEDCADSQDNQNNCRVNVLEESDAGNHSITDEDIESDEEPLFSDNRCNFTRKDTTEDSPRGVTQCHGECRIPEQTQPYQPNLNYSKITRKPQGCQYRSFRPEWYKTYKWSSFCVSQKKVFCFYCRFIRSRDLKFSEDCEDAFTKKGFDNWKKCNEKFKKHGKSQAHPEALFKFQAFQQPSISSQINLQHADKQVKQREALLKQLSSLKYLVRQGTSIRGHKDDEGNLIEMLKCRSEDVPALAD